MTEEKVFINGPLGKVCGVLHSVDNKSHIVIIVHGFSANKNGGPKILATEIESVGVNALRIDLDNMGESELDFEKGCSIPNYITQIESAIAFCKEQNYQNISLLGTSYGGLAAFGVTLTHPEIHKLLLRSPAVSYEDHVSGKYTNEELSLWKRQKYMPYNKNGTIYNVNSDFIEKSTPFSFFENAQKIQCPTLIIIGTNDTEINVKQVPKVVPIFNNCTLHTIQGADHSLGVHGDYSEGLTILKTFLKE